MGVTLSFLLNYFLPSFLYALYLGIHFIYHWHDVSHAKQLGWGERERETEKKTQQPQQTFRLQRNENPADFSCSVFPGNEKFSFDSVVKKNAKNNLQPAYVNSWVWEGCRKMFVLVSLMTPNSCRTEASA